MAADERPLPSRESSAADERATRTRGKQTVRRLLQAGREALDDAGFDELRVDDVVRRAGTSHGTFYLYFSDKRDLLDALGSDLDSALADVARTMPNLDPGEECRHALQTWLNSLLRLLAGQAGVVRALLSADPSWDWRRLTAVLEETITHRLDAANGAAPGVPSDHAAWGVAAMIIGLAAGAPTDKATQDSLARMLQRGLLNPPS